MSGSPSLYKPTSGEWRKHTSRSQPVHDETIVEPWFGFGRGKYTYRADQLNWSGFNDETRIKGYRVVQEAGE